MGGASRALRIHLNRRGQDEGDRARAQGVEAKLPRGGRRPVGGRGTK